MDTKTLNDLKESVGIRRTRREDLLKVVNEAAQSATKADDGTMVLDPERAKEASTAAEEAKALREAIERDEAMIAEVEWGNSPKRDSIAISLAAGLRHLADVPEDSLKDLSEQFIESEAFRDLVKSGGFTMASPFEFKGDAYRAWREKDVFSASPTSGSYPIGFGRIERDPLVEMPRRSLRIRDLFGTRTTSAAIIEYFRVTGRNFAASTVGERDGNAFALKPLSSLNFEHFRAIVQTIAHGEVAHRNVLADEPQLRGIIDNELLYGLQLQEDHQILYGSGVGNDLEGIHVVNGTQDYAWSSGELKDNKADAIRRAATLAFLSDYEPTGVVVHPNDWEDMELAKDDNGQYLLAVAIAVGAEKRVWRMRVVDTPAEHDGTALVGAFGLGAQLYDREEGNIRIAEQHEDFFMRNAVVILGEERLALAVKRPDSFVEVSFDAAPS